MAWYLRSRPCFAEPPADSPSTTNSSQRAGSRSWQSASFPGNPLESIADLRRVSSRALRAASRARAASMHLLMMRRATVECLSNHSPSFSFTSCSTSPLMSLLSLPLVPFKLRLRQPHADHGNQSFPHVVAGDGDFVLGILEHAGLRSEIVDRPRKRRAEPGKMRAAVHGIDGVREREHVFAIGVVVL